MKFVNESGEFAPADSRPSETAEPSFFHLNCHRGRRKGLPAPSSLINNGNMQSLAVNAGPRSRNWRAIQIAPHIWVALLSLLLMVGAGHECAAQQQPTDSATKAPPAKLPPKAPPTRVRIPISPEDEAAILAADALIPREQVPTGPMATLSLFGSKPAIGRSFVFVIDRSSSMSNRGMGAIQTAAKELTARLTKMRPEQTVQVVAYNEKATYLTGRDLIPATAENKRNLVAFISSLEPIGQTVHSRGVSSALRVKPEVIFLLTDGGDPLLSLGDLLAIRDENAGRTEIHCIQFGRGPEPQSADILKKLAAQNRGHYTYVDLNSR
jgi:hypothetical protein